RRRGGALEVGSRAMGPRAARLALVAASACAALLVAEGIWRLFFTRPGFSPHSELSAPGMIVPHPRRSYTLASGWSGRMRGVEFDVGFRTDALGCRIPLPPAGGCAGQAPAPHPGEGSAIDESAHTFTIPPPGDSFPVGHGLEAESAWPESLARRLEALSGRPICLVNGAVSAYNMAQVRDRAEELAPQVHPDLIVLGLFVNGAERMGNPYVLYEGD